MNLESIANETLLSLTEEDLLTNAAGTRMTPSPIDQPSSKSTPKLIEENEDLAFAKASTFIGADEELDSADSLVFEPVVDGTLKHYVQGIVLGQRACLMTNLLDGESQTLFQPQMIWTIGRNREAALPLRDRMLSRRHAVILYVPDEGFYLVDLNSMNGSFVNGVRIQQRQLLKDGDRLRLGSFEFSFFTSSHTRLIDPIHPEVLARFTMPESRSEFIDYSALEEPEVLFGTHDSQG